MSESILAMYATNCWSFFHSAKTKRVAHWVIQTIGAFFIIGGIVAKYIQRENLSLNHITTTHSIFGFISFILLVNSILLGICALWAFKIGRLFGIQIFIPKLVHNILGTASFVTGKYLFG